MTEHDLLHKHIHDEIYIDVMNDDNIDILDEHNEKANELVPDDEFENIQIRNQEKATEEEIEGLTAKEKNELITDNVVQTTLHSQKGIEKIIKMMMEPGYLEKISQAIQSQRNQMINCRGASTGSNSKHKEPHMYTCQ